jgi:hypothetical protein
MAKIVLTIEDRIDGNVKIVSDPTFETMAMKLESGGNISAGEAYALFVLRKIRETSKAQGKIQHKIPGA